jgi:2-phospho-L-lactate transferase/gluconeogenesis factor (CofD/UPF0052 family)
MKIVILTGGTGSIALQGGLYHRLEKHLDGIEVKVLVNAYDNGLSTGVVRRVMDGQILGPSDVRKNQTTRLHLTDPHSPWLPFLSCRFTADAAAAYERCRTEVNNLTTALQRQERQTGCRRVLMDAIEEFFKTPLSSTIGYDDFSLANIIYAGLARANGNSLRQAGSVMAKALGIANTVLLNDDKSLFLGAVSRSGKRITDEGEIVDWGKIDDPFVDLFFLDADGKESMPELCLEAWRALVEADLVILSAGTQWSSLLPTYASRGFRAALRDSSADVVLVMNRTPDRDSPSQTASDIVDLLVPRYFDAGRLHVLLDTNGHPSMRCLGPGAVSKVASALTLGLSSPAQPPDKHDPLKLADAIGYVFFREYLDSNFFLFDYDDTLVGRNNSYPKSSRFNISGLLRLNEQIQVGICTGNTVKALRLKAEHAAAGASCKPLLVFADGGVNAYTYDVTLAGRDERRAMSAAKCVSPDALLPKAGPHSPGRIIEALRRAGIPGSSIENRGDALIAIKPIDHDHRRAVMSLVSNLIAGSGLQVGACGRTTIEIRKPSLSKVCALEHLYTESVDSPRITYVGDECASGNDRDVDEFATAGSSVRCLRVGSPAKTAFFISTLLMRMESDANR